MELRDNAPVYSITMKQVHLKLHRDLKPTLVWGYNGMVPGPTFETHEQSIDLRQLDQ